MLGFLGAKAVQKGGWWGSGKGVIWLDDVRCRGSETSLEQCDHSPWGVSNCNHDEDVGIECTSDPSALTTVSKEQLCYFNIHIPKHNYLQCKLNFFIFLIHINNK